MGVSKYNSEGYHDPVVYEALTRIEAEERAARAAAAYRPLVYICSPYTEMWRRIRSGQGRFPGSRWRDTAFPIAPHLLCPQYLDEKTERWLGIKMGIVFMGKCEEVWVFGDTVSEGMAAEIEKARKLRKKIRYFTDDLREKEGMAG